MVEMEISRIIINEKSNEQIIVVREVNGKRTFPIVIGIWEAITIDRNIKQQKTPRPMTHDLLENVIKAFNANLERVVITDIVENTFYAKLILTRDGKVIEIDSRPSDAVALAVQMHAPIYAEEDVLGKVGTSI